MAKTALVAVGGNSLIRAGEEGTIAEQLANTRRTAQAIVGLIRFGYNLVITHGNGPQVGAQLLRSERASDVVYGQTLDVCGAASQGEIGYLLAQSLQNELAAADMDVPVVRLVTQTVVSPGGGGIPVMRVNGRLQGVEAVIDKDRASALLASQLGVDLFAISTDTEYVFLNYKKPNQTPLTSVTAAQLEEHLHAGHFPPGNMGPKVESVLRFLHRGGKEAVITSYEHLREAVQGSAGTHIVADPEPASKTVPQEQELEVPVVR